MRKDYDNIIILLGEELEPHLCKRVSIENGVIVDIKEPEPVTAITGSGLVIMPGLWNGHTHLNDGIFTDGTTGLTLEEGFFRPNGYKYQALSAAKDAEISQGLDSRFAYMLETGTVGHIDFCEGGENGTKRMRNASLNAGIQSVILGQMKELPISEDEIKNNDFEFNSIPLASIDRLMQQADGFSESTMNDLPDGVWKQIKHAAEVKNKLKAIHCLENEGYRDNSIKLTGRGDLERAIDVYGADIVIHMTVANDDEIHLAAKSGVTVVINPRANAVLGLPLPPIAKLIDSGVNLLLGTDNAMLNSPNMFAEMDFTYKIAKSQSRDPKKISPKDILKMATSNMRRLKEGSIATGFLNLNQPADYLIVDFNSNHLKHSKNILASIVTRIMPGDIQETCIKGKSTYLRTHATSATLR